MTITINGKCQLAIKSECLHKAFKQAKKSKVIITEIIIGEK